MNFKVLLPEIGLDSVEVVEILVSIGEKIKKKQPIVVVEGNKVSMEIPSPVSGIVHSIPIQIKDVVQYNQLILVVQMGNIQSNVNGIRNKDDKKIQIEGKKIKKEKKEIKIEKKQAKKLNNNKFSVSIKNNRKDIIPYASPFIRRKARKLKIDLKKLKGSQKKNRIVEEDLYNYISGFKSCEKKFLRDKHLENQSNSEKYFSKFGEVTKTFLGTKKKYSSIHLSNSWKNIPHVTHFEEIEINKLEKFRNKVNLNFQYKKNFSKITITSFVIKIIAYLLSIFPNFNSSFSEKDFSIILKKYINVGIAVNTHHGLVVPIIKNANSKSILDISLELKKLSLQARENKLNLKDTEGGSITITNIGAIGSSIFTPIINSPEVAILGMSKAVIKPIWKKKKFIPSLILPFSLSYDHRVINGVDAANFMCSFKEIIEDIRLLFI